MGVPFRDIGKMSSRIDIHTSTKLTNTGSGHKLSFSSLATVWANKQRTGGLRRTAEGEHYVTGETLKFYIRYISSLAARKPAEIRIKYPRTGAKARRYHVTAINEVMDDRFLEIICDTNNWEAA